MRFFTVNEFVHSVFIALLYGAVCGMIYKVLILIFYTIKSILLSPIEIWKILKAPSLLKSLPIIDIKQNSALSKVSKNLLEGVAFLAFGIGLIFCIYAVLDGVIRFYFIVFVGFAFFASKNTLGSIFEKIWICALSKTYGIFILLSSLFLLPIYKAILLFYSLLCKMLAPLCITAYKKRSNKICRRKILEITPRFQHMFFLDKS